jgi:type IV pilus assembly protein PilC
MAVSANKIHLSGLARKLVMDGLIDEASAADHFQKALAKKQAGTPLVEAMTSVAGACGNIVFYKATMKMRDAISTGTQLQAQYARMRTIS